MKKKVLLLTVFCVALGLSGAFAQAGVEPKLAAASVNESKQSDIKHPANAKPVLAPVSTGTESDKKQKAANNTRKPATPQLAASGKNEIVQPEKK